MPDSPERQNVTLNDEFRYLNSLYNETKGFIKEIKSIHNREIVIISSDKGNRTVIMEKRKYNDLAENILNDETAYSRYGTKIKNCSGFMKVDQFLVAGSLLSPKILISPK
jgi:hypothetical protein